MFYFFQGCWAVGLLCLCCHLGCAVASQVLRWFLNCAPFYSFQDIKPLSKKEDVLTDEQTQELKEIFELYDVDNSGTISLAEIRPILVNCGYEDEEVSKIWKECDKDRSGELEFDEFISLMKQAYFGTSFLDED
mmetsp:Transcript_10786/g.28284  ORF Transcript_10786/g.28284 Transcript_10786/m.28284 type:complete len:134 (-) Transcript_10786:373-774(-)